MGLAEWIITVGAVLVLAAVLGSAAFLIVMLKRDEREMEQKFHRMRNAEAAFQKALERHRTAQQDAEEAARAVEDVRGLLRFTQTTGRTSTDVERAEAAVEAAIEAYEEAVEAAEVAAAEAYEAQQYAERVGALRSL